MQTTLSDKQWRYPIKECPITGLPLLQKPQWHNVGFGSSYRADLSKLGDHIIISRPSGYATKHDVTKALELGQAIYEEAFGRPTPVVLIEDYTGLKGASLAARQAYVNRFRNAPNVVGGVYFGIPPLMEMLLKLAIRLRPVKVPIKVAKGYGQAVQAALEIIADLDPSRHGTAPGALRPANGPPERIARPDWSLEIENFSVNLELIDHDIMSSVAKGFLGHPAVAGMDSMRRKFTEDLGPGQTWHYILSDISGIKGVDWRARRDYMANLREFHRNHPISMFVFFGASPMMQAAAKIGRAFMPFAVRVAKDFNDGLQIIRRDRNRRRGRDVEPEPEDSLGGYANEILAHIGLINWDQEGVANSPAYQPGHPFADVFEAIRFIKMELDQLFQEREQAEVEKANLQARLRQAQKMEAIGTLAGGVAHEFNNLMQIISGYLYLLQEGGNLEGEDLDHIKAVEKAIGRGDQLVKNLMAFSRKTESDLKPLDLNALVKKVIPLLRGILPKMVAIKTQLAPDLPLLPADDNQIQQVLLNLANNAKDAMEQGGELLISTKMVELDQAFASEHPDVEPGQYLRLAVRDTGKGMEPQIRERVFEPFFTTKINQMASGLGLSMAYGIAKAHHGHLSCTSQPGKGSEFALYLPHRPADQDDLASSIAADSLAGGEECILFVDDEADVLQSQQGALARLGYQVLTAASGEEALDIYRQSESQIAVVVLDLSMPGMGGLAALRQIMQINPQAKVLVASGYSEEGIVQDSLGAGAGAFLSKPYRISELTAIIRQMISDPGQAINIS